MEACKSGRGLFGGFSYHTYTRGTVSQRDTPQYSRPCSMRPTEHKLPKIPHMSSIQQTRHRGPEPAKLRPNPWQSGSFTTIGRQSLVRPEILKRKTRQSPKPCYAVSQAVRTARQPLRCCSHSLSMTEGAGNRVQLVLALFKTTSRYVGFRGLKAGHSFQMLRSLAHRRLCFWPGVGVHNIEAFIKGAAIVNE